MKKLILFILTVFLIVCSTARAQTYSLNSTNSTTTGTAIQHNLFWQDGSGLSSYIFSFDECIGELSNITSGPLSGAENWSRVTTTVSSIDCTIRWRFYANNTNNVWSSSDTYSYVATYPVAPQITIDSPLNETYGSGTIDLNISIDKPTTWIGYSLNNRSNVTISGSLNLELSEGSYHLIVYATDLSGNTEKAEVFFKVDIPSIDLFIDNYVKKPGERIKVDAVSSYEISEASFSIVKPDKSLLMDPISMTAFSPKERTENYSLGTDLTEGIYKIRASAKINDQTVENSTEFLIKAWNIFIILNKYVFNYADDVRISVNVFDAYSNDLDLNITVNLTKPNRNIVSIYRNSTKGNSIKNITYNIPENYPNGTSMINVYVNDSYGRFKQGTVSFYKSTATESISNDIIMPFLFITPYIWSEVTTFDKIFQVNFELENSGNADITNISLSIPDVLSKLIHVVSKPDVILSRSKSNLTLEANTNDVELKNYSDFINIYSSDGNQQIYASIEVLGNISSSVENYLNEVKSLEEELKNIEIGGKDVKNVSESLVSLKQEFNEATDYYNSGNINSAKIKMNSAVSGLSEIKTQIDYLKILKNKEFDYSIIIWIFTVFVIVTVVGIVLIKYVPKARKKKESNKKAIGKEETVEVYSQKDV